MLNVFLDVCPMHTKVPSSKWFVHVGKLQDGSTVVPCMLNSLASQYRPYASFTHQILPAGPQGKKTQKNCPARPQYGMKRPGLAALSWQQVTSQTKQKKKLAHSGIVVWSQNLMLGDLPVLNGKRSSELPARNHAYLRKAWARLSASALEPGDTRVNDVHECLVNRR